MSNGLSHILKNQPNYDVRKVKDAPEYVVFFGDEEIGRLDFWGQKVLTMLWGPEPTKIYRNTPEAALTWIINSHEDSQLNDEFDYPPMAM